ncbi:hypothetical protein EJB05_34440 [Eragrostis curvula]|uniref:Uncharacterized protein n=1 Tax=Eragrostis curvula TaxID=38414 RepID=A0A5J9U5C5_9POAL|nr:hypothetical protein EJB05_34440 [Eragrostis curvula]
MTSPTTNLGFTAKFVLQSRRNPTFPQQSPSAAFDLDGNDHALAVLDVDMYHAVPLHVSVKL